MSNKIEWEAPKIEELSLSDTASGVYPTSYEFSDFAYPIS